MSKRKVSSDQDQPGAGIIVTAVSVLVYMSIYIPFEELLTSNRILPVIVIIFTIFGSADEKKK